MNSNTTLLPHYALGHSEQGGLIHQVAVANPHISGSHFALSEKTV